MAKKWLSNWEFTKEEEEQLAAEGRWLAERTRKQLEQLELLRELTADYFPVEEVNCCCDSCGRAFRCEKYPQGASCLVTLNASHGLDGLGWFPLADHPDQEAERLFCSDACFWQFLQKHPEQAVACVPPEEKFEDETFQRACEGCGKGGVPLISVKGEYGSVFDDINYPYYFCSVSCIIAEIER